VVAVVVVMMPWAGAGLAGAAVLFTLLR
jgi:hypothetical protein